MDRRRVLVSSTAALAASILAPRAFAETLDDRLTAAKGEAQVVVYTTQSVEPMQGLTQRFQAAVPGIQMQVLRIPTAERILAERGANRPGADVFLSWWDSALQLPARDYSASYTPNGIDGFPKDALDPNGKWMKVAGYVNVIGYNTDLVKDKPKGYKDLIDPKYKDKIGIGDPRGGGGNYFYYYTMWKAYGPDFFKELAKNDPSIQHADATVSSVGAGQFELGIAGEPGWQLGAQSGAPIAYVYPDEGVNVNYWYETILDNAPHPNAARVFVDWLVSKDGQDAIARVPRGIYPLLPGVPGPAGAPGFDKLKIGPFDQAEFMSQDTLQKVTAAAAGALGLKMSG